MKKDFKCRDCGVVFNADDQEEVKCQACGSDNIDEYKSPKKPQKNWIYLLLAFLIAIGLGVGISLWVKSCNGPEEIGEPPVGEEVIDTMDVYGPVVEDSDPIMEPELVETQKITPNEETKKY